MHPSSFRKPMSELGIKPRVAHAAVSHFAPQQLHGLQDLTKKDCLLLR